MHEASGCHVLNPLGVIDGQTQENRHADIADDDFQDGAGQEKVDDRRDDNADQPDEQDLAPTGQVLFGGETDNRHEAEE